MTFSIVGRSVDGSALGVAVASKFLAVGAYVPAAAANVGALATQAEAHLGLKSEGLRLMASGLSAQDALSRFLAADPKAPDRQAGLVDAAGGAATFTGDACLAWAGGMTGEGPEGAFAVQGNILTGPHVVEAMAASWRASAAEPALSRRLLMALAAGDAAGGDSRGRQAAALLVVAPGAGYGGTSDVAVDLRADDAADPVGRLGEMLQMHELYFGSTPEAELLPLTEPLADEVARLLTLIGAGDSEQDVAIRLNAWMDRENFEERSREGRLDPVVLDYLRRTALAQPSTP
jgi:uncharacterized Ntn-hydrolase superfamily protein